MGGQRTCRSGQFCMESGREYEQQYSRRRAAKQRAPRSRRYAGSYVNAAGISANRRRRYNVNLDYVPHTWKGKLERDLRVDNVRGILIILVVIGHFLLPLYQTRLITNLLYLIYSFHMPCFIMISGFYAKSLYKDGYFRWGKVLQLLWLYFLFKMIVNVTEGLLAGYVPLFPDFIHESGAPWYLMALAIWYLTIPLFRYFREYPINVIAILAVLFGVIFLKYRVTAGDLFSIDRVLSFAPFFYIGYFYSQENLDAYLASPAKKGVDALALLFAAVIFFGMYDFFMRYHLVVYGAQYDRYDPLLWNGIWLINLIWYVVAFTMSLGLISITLNRRMLVLTTLGQRSLQVYMLHRPIRDLCQYFGFYDVLNPHSKLTTVFIVLLSVGLSVALGSNGVFRAFNYVRTAPDRLLKKLGAV